MDIQLPRSKKSKRVLFSPFEYADVIPYTIALLMIGGLIYFVFLFCHLFLTQSK